MALSMLLDNKETTNFQQMVNGFYCYDDFLELGTSVGLNKRKQQFIELVNNRRLRLLSD